MKKLIFLGWTWLEKVSGPNRGEIAFFPKGILFYTCGVEIPYSFLLLVVQPYSISHRDKG
jgi:hypothetical protein